MRLIPWILLGLIPFCNGRFGQSKEKIGLSAIPSTSIQPEPISYPPDSWQYYLQHLPMEYVPIVDFQGNQISNQEKHFAVLRFDVGTADLQQCADALMRLRAEFLFGQKKYSAIGFHFNSGHYYAFSDYLKGIRPQLKNGEIHFIRSAFPAETTHSALRRYLDNVYAYANTVSLCKELKMTTRLETGTVIIVPGHPGHCSIIIDAAILNKTDTVFKLAEGYMPAQSIYVLSNPFEPDLNPWYHLGKREINTASTSFRSYFLRKFE